MSNSVRPHRWQPTRLPSPWDFPGKNTGVCCHFLLQCMKVKSESEVAQSCPILRDPMDCSLPGSSVHGIFQARVLEWGAIAFSISHGSYALLDSFSSLWQLAVKQPSWVVLLCCSACQALKWPPWIGFFSIAQCIRHLKCCSLWCLFL